MKKNWNSKYNLFFYFIKKMLLIYLLLLTVFMLFRTFVLFRFGNFDELKNYKLDLLKAFYVGGKFDTSVIAYGLLPLLIIVLLFSFLWKGKNRKYFKLVKKTIKIYSIFLAILFFIISVIDYFFYKFFQTHINPVIFGIKEDKTSAVIASIWNDYPVILVLILLLTISYIFIKIINIIIKNEEIKPINFRYKFVTVLLILGLYFVAIRGTLGSFPLRLRHTTISTNTQVNELVLNGAFALKMANSLHNEYKEFSIETDKILNKNSFKTKEEAHKTYFGNTKETLLKTTDKNEFLSENPPNVVFLLVEGLGKQYFDLHSNETNLLGDLEQELPYLYFFNNILSATNGTIRSMESLLVGTPQSSLGQTPYFTINFKGSVANPFKDSGYQTTYLTGDNLGWHNSGNFIKNQSFDNVLGYNFLKEKFKNPEEFVWGIHDEYLYQHIFDVLNNTKKPQFIFTLTISNHTPNDVPTTFKQKPVKLTKPILDKIRMSKDYVYKNFISYQYTADALGKLIHKIRTSPLGKNTIIVATGDHNVRGLFNYNDNELFLKRSVPIIMYVPDAYKPKNDINLNRFGSHKDIFPTIFNIALSEKEFIKTGDDLFENKNPKTNYFGENAYNLAGNKKGIVFIDGKPQYFKWKDTINFKGLEPTTKEKTPELYELQRKMQAHETILFLQIQKNILSTEK